MVTIATNRAVGRDDLIEFVRPRHHGVLITVRRDGWPQSSLVTMGVSADDRHILVSSYPERAKVHNLRRTPRASMVVMSDEFDGEWVQVDGDAEVVDLPDALDDLVEYFTVISGEHSDWDEYRAAMRRQGKCLTPVDPDRSGSATGIRDRPASGRAAGPHSGSSNESTDRSRWRSERRFRSRPT